MTTPYPVKWIARKKYYRVPQSQALTPDGGVPVFDPNYDACTGCALKKLREIEDCPQYRDKALVNDQPVLCQDYGYDEDGFEDGTYWDYHILKDYIFIPATKKGIADYVAHLLEVS